MTQRDCMRVLFIAFGGYKDSIVKAYADVERAGLVKRERNMLSMTPDEYAQRLYNDGIQKQWFKY